VAETLSLHFQRAGRHPETWRYSVIAGRRAEEKYANVEAAAFFERALEVVKRVPGLDPEEISRIWEALGDVRMRMSAFEAAGAAFRESRAVSPGGSVEDARLMQKEAMIPLRLGRYPQALRRLTQALRTLTDVPGDDAAAQRARLLGWYATVLQYQRRPRTAIEWCEKTIEAATGLEEARDALAHAYFILDWAYAALGRLDEAVYSERAIDIYEELGDLDRLAWVLNNLGGLTYLRGRWDEALELAERARTTFLRMGDESQASIAALNIAEVRSDQGRMDEAEPVFREVLDVRKAAGNPLKIAEAWSLLGRHLARVGEHEEARAVLEEARELFEAEGDAEDLLTTDAWLSECHVLEGNTAAGLELSLETLERAESLSGVSVVVTHLHRTRGWAYMQMAELVNARTALEESLRIARGDNENFGIMSADYEVALTLNALVRLRGLTGEPTEEIAYERDMIFARLGVLSVPEPPLPH
jgi:tetratricopeptide (TPR) repeat protein